MNAPPSALLTDFRADPERVWAQPLATDRAAFDLAPVLTLLLLLLYVEGDWYVEIPTRALAISAFILAPLRRSPKLWFLIGILLLAGVRLRWSQADNHQYLIAYWCLALSCAFQASDPLTSLKTAARWTIGLCFLFAFAWKVISPDFIDGTFFHYSLLADERFAGVARLAGGISPETAELNEAAVHALTNFDSRLDEVRLQDTPAIRNVALLLTAWTFAIEGLVAAAFLAPPGSRFSRWRDPLLLLFVASTYTVAPVVGFGWTLLIMGLVQAADRFRWTRWAYAVIFVVLQIYLIPWRSIAGPVMDSLQ